MKAIMLSLSLLISSYCISQTTASAEFTAGAGLIESTHIGCKLQVGTRHVVGLYVGKSPSFINASHVISLTTDYQYHFGKTSEKSTRPAWFIRLGAMYREDLYELWVQDYMINGGFGREFSLSQKFKLSADIVSLYVVHENVTREKASTSFLNLTLGDLFVFPMARIQVSYSF